MRLDELPAVLVPLGFTETEALVYGELLRQPDQTGYSLAKAIHKGQPVTYAALAGLENKGAVIGNLAAARAYRAIPPVELMGALRRVFDRRCELAEARLSQDVSPPPSDQLYQLKSRPQVMERAKAMLAGAQSTVLFEMFPKPFEGLREDLARAADRSDVAVAGLAFRDQDRLPGTRTVIPRAADSIMSVWRMDVLTLIVDARQILLAAFQDGAVTQAFWSDSLYLAVLVHNAVSANVSLHEIKDGDWTGPDRFLFGKLAPGFRELVGAG